MKRRKKFIAFIVIILAMLFTGCAMDGKIYPIDVRPKNLPDDMNLQIMIKIDPSNKYYHDNVKLGLEKAEEIFASDLKRLAQSTTTQEVKERSSYVERYREKIAICKNIMQTELYNYDEDGWRCMDYWAKDTDPDFRNGNKNDEEDVYSFHFWGYSTRESLKTLASQFGEIRIVVIDSEGNIMQMSDPVYLYDRIRPRIYHGFTYDYETNEVVIDKSKYMDISYRTYDGIVDFIEKKQNEVLWYLGIFFCNGFTALLLTNMEKKRKSGVSLNSSAAVSPDINMEKIDTNHRKPIYLILFALLSTCNIITTVNISIDFFGRFNIFYIFTSFDFLSYCIFFNLVWIAELVFLIKIYSSPAAAPDSYDIKYTIDMK